MNEVMDPETFLADTEEEAPEPMPLLAAIRELQEIVDGNGRIVVHVHDLPVETFSHDSVTGMRVNTMEGSTWLSGNIRIGKHDFTIYSTHMAVRDAIEAC